MPLPSARNTITAVSLMTLVRPKSDFGAKPDEVIWKGPDRTRRPPRWMEASEQIAGRNKTRCDPGRRRPLSSPRTTQTDQRRGFQRSDLRSPQHVSWE